MKNRILILVSVFVCIGIIAGILYYGYVQAGVANRIFGTEESIFATDLFGGAKSDVNTTEQYSSDIDLETNGYVGTQITIDYDASGTTNNLGIKIYAGINTSNYDDTALIAVTGNNNSGAQTQLTIILFDVLHARVGFVASGATDTFDVNCIHQAWRYNVADFTYDYFDFGDFELYFFRNNTYIIGGKYGIS